MNDDLNENNYFDKNKFNRKISNNSNISDCTNELNYPIKQNIQKFNVEKFEEKKMYKNNINLCQKCCVVINSFTFNEDFIRLLFNQKNTYFNINNNSSFINQLLLNSNICSNCLKSSLEQYYFKQTNNNYLYNNNLENIEKGISELFQVLESMEDEKLNINLRLYHNYKKLVGSYIEYIKDNNNDINDKNSNNKESKNIDKNSLNIKNQKIIGIDCILNIIELLNKNISIIKEKNAIKKKFLEEINNEKNSLIKEIKNEGNRQLLEMNDGKEQDKIQENINNIKNTINTNVIPSSINIFKDNKNEDNLFNKRIQKNNLYIFKTKLIRTKRKKKKLKRITRKIKFIIKTK